MEKFLIWIGAVGVIALGMGLGFLVFSGLVWLVCWAFDFAFSWKYAFGAWLIWIIVSQMFKSNVTVKQDNCNKRW